MQTGQTTLEDWRRQLQRAHVQHLVFSCDQQNCGFSLQEENSLLRKPRRAPRSIAVASVAFKDGIASETYTAMVIQGRNGKGEGYDDKGVVVRQSSDRPTSCNLHYHLSVKQRYGVGERFWATIVMDSCVSPKDRAKAFAINTACLSKIGGCGTIETMIPQVLGHP